MERETRVQSKKTVAEDDVTCVYTEQRMHCVIGSHKKNCNQSNCSLLEMMHYQVTLIAAAIVAMDYSSDVQPPVSG